MNKYNVIYKHNEYNPALKEIPIHANTWMNLESTMPITQAKHKRTNIIWLHLYAVPRVVKFIQKVEEWLPGAGGEDSFGEWESSGDGWRWLHDSVNILNATESYTEKWLKW